MADFMKYCLKQYYQSSGWNEENQYSNLCSWSRAILDFRALRGLSLAISKLPTVQFQSSNTQPTWNGNIGYIYTSKPLDIKENITVDFQGLIDQFRIVTPKNQVYNTNQNVKLDPDYLIYGRLFFPGAKLEAMYERRLSVSTMFSITAVNHSRIYLSPQVTIQLQRDRGKWSSEYYYKVNNGSCGIRALYNFNTPSASSQWSTGAEVYYGILDKTKGLSTGIRYRTRPASTKMPICFTYTLNPIAKNMSTSYSVKVSDQLTLCSRYDYGMKSCDRDLALGFEYRTRETSRSVVTDFDDDDVDILTKDRIDKLESLVKLRMGLVKGLAFLWEGRFRNISFSLGVVADLKSTVPIQTVGAQLQYFS